MPKRTSNRFNARIFTFDKRNNSHASALASAGIKINITKPNTNTDTNIDYSSYIIDF